MKQGASRRKAVLETAMQIKRSESVVKNNYKRKENWQQRRKKKDLAVSVPSQINIRRKRNRSKLSQGSTPLGCRK